MQSLMNVDWDEPDDNDITEIIANWQSILLHCARNQEKPQHLASKIGWIHPKLFTGSPENLRRFLSFQPEISPNAPNRSSQNQHRVRHPSLVRRRGRNQQLSREIRSDTGVVGNSVVVNQEISRVNRLNVELDEALRLLLNYCLDQNVPIPSSNRIISSMKRDIERERGSHPIIIISSDGEIEGEEKHNPPTIVSQTFSDDVAGFLESEQEMIAETDEEENDFEDEIEFEVNEDEIESEVNVDEIESEVIGDEIEQESIEDEEADDAHIHVQEVEEMEVDDEEKAETALSAPANVGTEINYFDGIEDHEFASISSPFYHHEE